MEQEAAETKEKQGEAVNSNDLLCPDCGGDVIYCHGSHRHRDGTTKVVCRKKCSGFKVIRKFKRT